MDTQALRIQIQSTLSKHKDYLTDDFARSISLFAESANFFQAMGDDEREARELRKTMEFVHEKLFGI